jgi:hypothetical protein
MSNTTYFFPITSNSTAALRAELRWLRPRNDNGKVSRAVFAVIGELETRIAWAERRREARS